MKCRDCIHYKEIDETKGTCFDVEIEGDRDPKDSETCKGLGFRPKNEQD